MADCEVDPWAFSRKGKLGSSEVFIGDITPPISEIARDVIKRQPCCKRNDHDLSCDLFYQ